MLTLSGRAAVITGASAGIGAAVARELASAGARLVLTARRQDRLDALAEELGCAALAADIGDPQTPSRLLALTQERFGRADILVNNAGVLRIGTLDSFDLADMDEMVRVNFVAPMRASYIFGRAMKTAGGGAIVNVSSIGAHLTGASTGIYGGLKRALEMATESLRIELAGSGVRVGLVAPGTTSTEIFEDMKADGQKGWDEYIVPLQPEDVARAVRYMLEQPAHANVARVHVYSSQEGF
ncbi:MAG: SDR family oxidoreductase [Alphaproteobacteria bacterium]|nr:SDR family oxidoreductase [Alphaproteobacteria bacterium]